MDRRNLLTLLAIFLVWRFLASSEGMPLGISLVHFVMQIAVFVLAISLHEFGHAWMATRLGDPTPKAMGRLTLNPAAHLDPLGTLLILVVQFGYAKPVQVNPAYFRRPGRDGVLVALAGPAVNLLLCGAAILTFQALYPRAAMMTFTWWPIWKQLLPLFLLQMAILNAILAIFNMIPIPPLDGSYLLDRLLSPKYRLIYRQNQSRIAVVALFLVLMGFLSPLFGAVANQVQRLCLM